MSDDPVVPKAEKPVPEALQELPKAAPKSEPAKPAEPLQEPPKASKRRLAHCPVCGRLEDVDPLTTLRCANCSRVVVYIV